MSVPSNFFMNRQIPQLFSWAEPKKTNDANLNQSLAWFEEQKDFLNRFASGQRIRGFEVEKYEDGLYKFLESSLEQKIRLSLAAYLLYSSNTMLRDIERAEEFFESAHDAFERLSPKSKTEEVWWYYACLLKYKADLTGIFDLKLINKTVNCIENIKSKSHKEGLFIFIIRDYYAKSTEYPDYEPLARLEGIFPSHPYKLDGYCASLRHGFIIKQLITETNRCYFDIETSYLLNEAIPTAKKDLELKISAEESICSEKSVIKIAVDKRSLFKFLAHIRSPSPPMIKIRAPELATEDCEIHLRQRLRTAGFCNGEGFLNVTLITGFSLRLMLNNIGNYGSAIKTDNEIIIVKVGNIFRIFCKNLIDNDVKDFICSDPLKKLLSSLNFNGEILAKNQVSEEIYKQAHKEVILQKGCAREKQYNQFKEVAQRALSEYCNLFLGKQLNIQEFETHFNPEIMIPQLEKLDKIRESLEGFNGLDALFLFHESLTLNTYGLNLGLLQPVKRTVFECLEILYQSRAATQLDDFKKHAKWFDIAQQIVNSLKKNPRNMLIKIGTPIEDKTYSDHAFYVSIKHFPNSNNFQIIITNGGGNVSRFHAISPTQHHADRKEYRYAAFQPFDINKCDEALINYIYLSISLEYRCSVSDKEELDLFWMTEEIFLGYGDHSYYPALILSEDNNPLRVYTSAGKFFEIANSKDCPIHEINSLLGQNKNEWPISLNRNSPVFKWLIKIGCTLKGNPDSYLNLLRSLYLRENIETPGMVESFKGFQYKEFTTFKRQDLEDTFLSQFTGNCTIHNLKKSLQILFDMNQLTFGLLEDTVVMGCNQIISNFLGLSITTAPVNSIDVQDSTKVEKKSDSTVVIHTQQANSSVTELKKDSPLLKVATTNTSTLFKAISMNDVDTVMTSIEALKLQDQNIQEPVSGKTLYEILLALNQEMQNAVLQAIEKNQKAATELEKDEAFVEQVDPNISNLDDTWEAETAETKAAWEAAGAEDIEIARETEEATDNTPKQTNILRSLQSQLKPQPEGFEMPTETSALTFTKNPATQASFVVCEAGTAATNANTEQPKATLD